LAWLAHLDDGTRARTLIRKLNQWYDQSGRAFRVEEVAGGYQMLTRQKFATWLRRLGHVPGEVRLSSPALETLAVIAYRQPVLKADIEAIRGVHCGEILRQLMERDLVRIGGRSDELGRPYLYQVTRRFMQIFGIRNLEELPRAEFLRDNPLPPVHKSSASGHHTSSDSVVFGEPKPSREKKESDVSVTLKSELAYEETRNAKFGPALLPHIRAEEDDEDDFEDEDELDDDDDDFEDDEEDEDFDDEEEEEDDFDDEDLEEDEDWEEVDDEDEDLDEEEDDEDWDDEDEDDDDWEEDEAEDDADDKE
jgi:segregation and condensation protein B